MTERRWLRFLSLERGALLWLPSLWGAAALVLFGILQAASELSFDNQTRELRVAVGPLAAAGVPATQLAAFESGLRHGLAARRELKLVQAQRLQDRLESVLGLPLPAEPRRWMRATRNLNVSYYVSARLAQDGGLCSARVQLWDVADERAFGRFDGVEASAEALGLALADSVRAALFRPRAATTAWR